MYVFYETDYLHVFFFPFTFYFICTFWKCLLYLNFLFVISNKMIGEVNLTIGCPDITVVDSEVRMGEPVVVDVVDDVVVNLTGFLSLEDLVDVVLRD